MATLAEGRSLCAKCRGTFTPPSAARRWPCSLDHLDLAARLRSPGRNAREPFEDAFWCDDLGTYALALDGKKRPCRVRTSNAGHCLFTGIASPERAAAGGPNLDARRLVFRLGRAHGGRGEARYNPMSYHNGSVWPHDNALIAAGSAAMA